MTNTTSVQILTKAGEELLARLAAEEKELVIDKYVFADVPERPDFPQREDGVPTDYVVHESIIHEKGRLNANSVIYSSTLASDVGPFHFNWSGLYCSEHDVLVTIHYPQRTPKTADQPGVAGNTLVRSQVLQYTGVADITNITVDASSWQYNADPRMKKMDSDSAQAIVDQNGKDWFIEDGFLVTPQSTAFKVTPGAGYVSGHRVTLDFERFLQVPNKPSFIYVDAYREGTPTGEWVTTFNFVVSADEKDDYLDAQGLPHYVVKIAQVMADGSVADLRPEEAMRYWIRLQTELLEKQQVGSVWPVHIDECLTIGAQTTTVSRKGISVLRIELEPNHTGTLFYLWRPSGDFSLNTHTITEVKTNDSAGIDVTTEHGQFEFVTRDVLDLRGHDLASLKDIIASDKAVYRTSVADFNEHLSGGGGDFVYDKSDSETEENGITVIVPRNGGRLKKPNLSPIALSEGKCRSGIDNRSHLQKLFAVSVSEKRALIIDGDYEFSGNIDTENVSLIGHGRRKSILRPMGSGSHLWLGSFLDASDFSIIGDMKCHGLVSKKNAGQWILDNLLITGCDHSVELSETYIGTLRDCELRANNKNIATTSRNSLEARVNNIRLFGGSLTQAKVAAIDIAAGQFTKNLQLYGTNIEDNAAGIRAYQNLVGLLLSGAWLEDNGTHIYAEKAFSGFRMLGGTLAFNNPEERGLVLGGNVQAGNTFEGVEFQIPDPLVQLYSVLHGRRLTMKECLFKRGDFARNDPNGLVRIINSAVGEGAQEYGYYTTGQTESGTITLLAGETKSITFSNPFYSAPKVTTGTLGGGDRPEPVMTAPTINGFTITNRGSVSTTLHWQATED